MSVGLELTNAGIEIGNAPRRREICKSVLLKIGNLSASVKEHPVVAPANAGCDDGNAHKLFQVDALATMRQFGGGNSEPAARSVQDVVEATKNICAEKTRAFNPNILRKRLGSMPDSNPKG